MYLNALRLNSSQWLNYWNTFLFTLLDHHICSIEHYCITWRMYRTNKQANHIRMVESVIGSLQIPGITDSRKLLNESCNFFWKEQELSMTVNLQHQWKIPSKLAVRNCSTTSYVCIIVSVIIVSGAPNSFFIQVYKWVLRMNLSAKSNFLNPCCKLLQLHKALSVTSL